MSKAIKNKDNTETQIFFESQEIDKEDTETLRPLRPGVRTIRRIHPLGMRVVVKLRKDTNMTETGLYLPEGAKEALGESVLGEVMEVASAIDEVTDEEANISGIPFGSLVLIPKNAGVKVPWDEELRIVETKEVLAMVGELDVI